MKIESTGQKIQKIAIIQGPNLNMLGKRESNHYGSFTMDELHDELIEKFKTQIEFTFFQSNHEGNLIDFIQNLDPAKTDGIVLNAGALTHTSVGLRDALLSVSIPFIEVHISNVFARDSFRHTSYLSDIARGVIAGLGKMSYFLAVQFFLTTLK